VGAGTDTILTRSNGTTWAIYSEATEKMLKVVFDDADSIALYGIRATDIELPHITDPEIVEAIGNGYLDNE
jgi:hypothetical protein